MNETAVPSPDRQRIVDFLKNAEYFRDLDENRLQRVETLGKYFVLPSRQPLMQQGDALEHIYVLISGRLHFELRNEEGVVTASGEFKAGDVIGEMSFVQSRRAISTVFSVRNCEILAIHHSHLETFLQDHPQTLFALTRKAIAVADRSLRKRPQKLRYSSFAVVPLDEHANVKLFCDQFEKVLQKEGTCVRINKEFLERELGPVRAKLGLEDEGFQENLRWLSRLCEKHNYVLLEADLGNTPWARICVQESDRILLVASKASNPVQNALEKHLAQNVSAYNPRSELIMLHTTSEKSNCANAFLAEREVARHHHIWTDSLNDFERLFRILNGTSLGLVFGGGGVRAATQIGLLKAFIEEGIPIDHIGGTSIGSLVAAFYAQGFDVKEMENIIRNRIVEENLFNDYVPPIVSITRGRKFSNFLNDIYGETLIEDLSIDYFAAATNLSRGTLETRDRGLVWQAVRASASLPGILPPFAEENAIYVDGGLLDNVPGEVMHQRGAGKVIAVDVSSATNTDGDRNLHQLINIPGSAPTFWRVLKNKFSRNRVKYSSLGDIIVRSMVVGSRENAQKIKDDADLYIRMPVDNFGMLEFSASAKLVEIGYQHTLDNMAEWKKTLYESVI